MNISKRRLSKIKKSNNQTRRKLKISDALKKKGKQHKKYTFRAKVNENLMNKTLKLRGGAQGKKAKFRSKGNTERAARRKAATQKRKKHNKLSIAFDKAQEQAQKEQQQRIQESVKELKERRVTPSLEQEPETILPPSTEVTKPETTNVETSKPSAGTQAANFFDSLPLSDDTTAPIATPEEQPTPTPEEQPTPAPEEQPTPAPEEQPTPVTEEQPTPAPEEQPTPTPEEQPTPVTEEQPTPVTEEQPTPAPEEQPTPAPEEQPTPVTEEQPTPALEEQPIPTPEEQPTETILPSSNELNEVRQTSVDTQKQSQDKAMDTKQEPQKTRKIVVTFEVPVDVTNSIMAQPSSSSHDIVNTMAAIANDNQ
jgi:hypothetical protein